jgi:urease accessory protein
MTTAIDAASIDDPAGPSERALLQMWFSPAFPIGGFAYSQGLEKAVEHGFVRDMQTLSAWVADLFEWGSFRNDLIFMGCAWRAVTAGDFAEVKKIAELAAAVQPCAERYLEAITQGSCFLKAIRDAWPNPAVLAILDTLREDEPVPYPVAAGLISGAYRLNLIAALESFALAIASAQISAGIRLGVIGQTAGQLIIA